MITAQEAKALAIEMLEYFVEHPECGRKNQLPDELYSKIKSMRKGCPLCERHFLNCISCCLGKCSTGSVFERWRRAITNEERKAAAQEALDKVRAWKVD